MINLKAECWIRSGIHNHFPGCHASREKQGWVFQILDPFFPGGSTTYFFLLIDPYTISNTESWITRLTESVKMRHDLFHFLLRGCSCFLSPEVLS